MKNLIKWEEAAMFLLSIVLISRLHHKGVAIGLYLAGLFMSHPALEYAGMILFGHSSMDRGMGYGLKYVSGFQDTNLGKIGKNKIERNL
jgi:hypothetical protein